MLHLVGRELEGGVVPGSGRWIQPLATPKPRLQSACRSHKPVPKEMPLPGIISDMNLTSQQVTGEPFLRYLACEKGRGRAFTWVVEIRVNAVRPSLHFCVFSLTKAEKENSAGLVVLFRSLPGGFALEFLKQTANFILGYRKYHSQLTLTNPIHRTDSMVPTLIPAPEPKGGCVHCGQTGAAPRPDTEPGLGQLGSRDVTDNSGVRPARPTTGITEDAASQQLKASKQRSQPAEPTFHTTAELL